MKVREGGKVRCDVEVFLGGVWLFTNMCLVFLEDGMILFFGYCYEGRGYRFQKFDIVVILRRSQGEKT